MPTIDDVLLTRRHRIVVPEPSGFVSESVLRALDVELAAVGYACSYRLRRAIGRLDPQTLGPLRDRVVAALSKARGGQVSHQPLFRSFPQDVPADTYELWLKKFVGFYLQHPDQPCLWCEGQGETHVLSCGHVACDRCFDGSSYAGCPVCEQHVDPSSPFFRDPSLDRSPSGKEPVRLVRLDLAGDRDDEVRAWVAQLCARAQPMTPDDVDALKVAVDYARGRVLEWLPDEMPVRENVAHVFGALMNLLDPRVALEAARPRLGTATDVLRLIAAYSGADPSLAPVMRAVPLKREDARRWSGRWRTLAVEQPAPSWWRLAQPYPHQAGIAARTFQVKRMGRPLRRDLLAILEGLHPDRLGVGDDEGSSRGPPDRLGVGDDEGSSRGPPDALVEDLLRHAAAWKHVGRVLHPTEHAERFPNVARAFAVVRGHGTFAGFAARAEQLREVGDVAGLVDHLATRPGELVRRLDDTLRRAGTDLERRLVLDRFSRIVGDASSPALIGLLGTARRRTSAWPARVWFPKGPQFWAPAAPDRRPVLPPEAVDELVTTIEAELLRRCAARPPVEVAVLDADLERIVAPFVERSAARSAVQLPRGSRVELPDGPVLRLFLHWCQPRTGSTTDIDLSVGFFDADWKHTGVCSYYSLSLTHGQQRVAAHSGDWRDAPWPDGASEFVDLHRDVARAAGFRYAMMVVTNYHGMPFSGLERAFAGVMVRHDTDGAHFDPRTVELRFDVQGQGGVFAPLVLDLESNELVWLDVSNRGSLEFNNVADASKSLERIGRDVLAYFGTGARLSMLDLGRLHAAARAQVVWERRRHEAVGYRRRPGEAPLAFLRRLKAGESDQTGPMPDLEGSVLAALVRGDLPLPDGSEVYVLFPGAATGNVAAADWIV